MYLLYTTCTTCRKNLVGKKWYSKSILYNLQHYTGLRSSKMNCNSVLTRYLTQQKKILQIFSHNLKKLYLFEFQIGKIYLQSHTSDVIDICTVRQACNFGNSGSIMTSLKHSTFAIVLATIPISETSFSILL